MYIKSFLLISFICSGLFVLGQEDDIYLVNPSFEDKPHRGGPGTSIMGWTDCGLMKFPGESPPDIHPAPGNKGFWENNLPAAEGATYLGMVVRDNNTYESVGQKLSSPLLKNQCYDFTIYLSRAAKYVSLTHMTQTAGNYTTPIVLRIWGGRYPCEELELLAESEAVNNTSWQINNFTIKPKRDIQYITFAAFYKTPVLFPYNGNILIDGCSSFKWMPCPGEPIANTTESNGSKTSVASGKTSTSKSAKSAPGNSAKETARPKPVFVPKILTELDAKKIKQGQIIELKNLYFQPDSFRITEKSKPLLDDLVGFLNSTEKIILEIGGHTNNVPPDEYCDMLSTARAKSVAEYLVSQGVDQSKVQFKGYGKRNPIMSNKTQSGRLRNQRVEIKILSIE